MQHTLLISNDFALEECASLQPNSCSWQNEIGCAPLGGFTASSMGYLLAMRPHATTGDLRPVDNFTMQTCKGHGMAGTGSMGMDNDSFVVPGNRRFAEAGGMMRQETRPATAQIQIGDYSNIGSSGTTGTFKKINTGSHSRLGGLPPLTKASAPPGRASADPGGGPTAS